MSKYLEIDKIMHFPMQPEYLGPGKKSQFWRNTILINSFIPTLFSKKQQY